MSNFSKTVQEKLVQMLQPDFDFDIKDRILVVSDLDHFKAKEDPFVWGQKKGKVPEFYEVYWDNEWIMDFHEGDTPELVYIGFLKGFGEAYEAGKVRLNKMLADAERANDLETMIKKQRIEKMKEVVSGAFEVGSKDGVADNPEAQEIAEQVTKEITKEKNVKK